MKTIIAGGRDLFDTVALLEAIKASAFHITQVVSGGQRGMDSLGEAWARANSVSLVIFHANWKEEQKAAGPIRNEKMASYGEGLIAIWDGKSRGTADMISRAVAHKLSLFIYIYAPNTSNHGLTARRIEALPESARRALPCYARGKATGQRSLSLGGADSPSAEDS